MIIFKKLINQIVLKRGTIKYLFTSFDMIYLISTITNIKIKFKEID